jgi:hypothetical protein
MYQRTFILFKNNNSVKIGPFASGTTYHSRMTTPGTVCFVWLNTQGIMKEVTVTYDMVDKLTISTVDNMKSIGSLQTK